MGLYTHYLVLLKALLTLVLIGPKNDYLVITYWEQLQLVRAKWLETHLKSNGFIRWPVCLKTCIQFGPDQTEPFHLIET